MYTYIFLLASEAVVCTCTYMQAVNECCSVHDYSCTYMYIHIGVHTCLVV